MTTSAPRSRLRLTTGLSLALGLGIAACAGCGGGGKAKNNYPDAVAFDSATGGAVGTGGATDAGAGTGGTPVNPDAGVRAGNTLLVPGPAALFTPGVSCSFPPTVASAAAPDQWCGAILPGPTSGTFTTVVFNLTKAMAGTAISCAVGDPNCQRLTDDSSPDGNPTGGFFGLTSGFFGQTFIYYDSQSVFAWRPGWTAGRLLVARGANDAICKASFDDVTNAVCIELTSTDGTTMNLRAGSIATQAGAPLPLVEPISFLISGAELSLDSQSVIWSTSTSATAPEILKMQTIGDDTTRKTIASNVTRWGLTADGQRWLWLSQPTAGATMSLPTTYTLQTAPYPAGTAPKTIDPVAVDYAAFAPTGIMVLTNATANGADLKAIANIDTPTSATTLETATTFGMVDLTPTGNVLYFTTAMADSMGNLSLLNLKASKADGTGKCTVTATANADPGARFTIAGTEVDWVRVTTRGTTTTAAGLLTPLATCAMAVYSTTLSTYPVDLNTTGFILRENSNATTGAVDLTFDPFSAARALGPGVLIQQGADPALMPLFPAVPKIVFSVNQGAATDGIYLSAALGGTTTVAFAPTQSSALTHPAIRGGPRLRAGTFGARATTPGATYVPAAFGPVNRSAASRAFGPWSSHAPAASGHGQGAFPGTAIARQRSASRR